MVTADLNDRMIVANEPDDGDIDDICMFFVSTKKFVHGISPPSIMLPEGGRRAVARNGSGSSCNDSSRNDSSRNNHIISSG